MGGGIVHFITLKKVTKSLGFSLALKVEGLGVFPLLLLSAAVSLARHG